MRVSYIIEIATDTNFATIIETGTSDSNIYSSTIGLNSSTQYYWKIAADQAPLTLSFWNFQAIEARSGVGVSACYDGGILEISTGGGTIYTQVLGDKVTRYFLVSLYAPSVYTLIRISISGFG